MTKVQKEMIWTLGLVVGLVMLFLAFDTEAHNHQTVNVTNNFYDVTEVQETTIIHEDDDFNEAVTKALACDHSFYWGKEDALQVSPQVAYYRNELEVCIGLGWRPDDTDVMFNFSMVPDEDTDEWAFQGGALIILDD